MVFDLTPYTDEIFRTARSLSPDMYSITVIEGGISSTLSVTPANQTSDTYSVSKAFTAAAVGLLYDEGKLSPEEKIASRFPDELPADADPRWQDVTIDMALRHRMGIGRGYLDIDAEDPAGFQEKYGSRDDYLKIVFSEKLPFEPDTHFQYSDAAYYLLSRVVERKAHVEMEDYLRERLFDPLDFSEEAWSKCPKGYSMGGTGLFARSEDMAKLGQVYLRNGLYKGRRIFSPEWCDLSMKREYAWGKLQDGIYFKGGMYDQIVYIDFHRDLSIAWLGHCQSAGFNRNRQVMFACFDRL